MSQHPQVIVIASGKGGTGKSTLSINLSMALADLGKRVAILDANLELPSIATLLNISPDYIYHYRFNRRDQFPSRGHL